MVLVAGDANPDLVLRGDVVPRFGQAEQLLESAELVVGGAAAITAHAFARLGRPVRLVAAVGADAFGGMLRGRLATAGVDVTGLLVRRGHATGLTVVLSGAGDRAMLTHPGAIPTLTAADVRAAVEAARPDGLCHVHVSSLFLQPALTRELPELLAWLRATGLSTSVDTNGDPAGRWLGVDALLPHLDVLLPNRAELTALAGESEPRAAALLLAARGPLVVAKDGEHGALAATPAGALSAVPAEPVVSVDTTGAGDTFDAAFLDGWLHGRPLTECLRRAVVAGARCVAAPGGTAGQPSAAELDDALLAASPP
jgi:sugar/nucleoside kinase (ribokinase family)